MTRKRKRQAPEAHDRSGLADLLRGRFDVTVPDELLDLALTHRSWAYENGAPATNERLEFLGDAVLGLATAHRLYTDHPDLPEGQLARRRSALVNTNALAVVARHIHLGSYVKLGHGEALDGGRDKASILADTTEAVIGSVYLSNGPEIAARFVLDLLAPLLADEAALEAGFDYKTRLQEIAAQRDTVSRYEISESGPEHARVFAAVALLGDEAVGEGAGHSKKDAEQRAAENACTRSGGLSPVATA